MKVLVFLIVVFCLPAALSAADTSSPAAQEYRTIVCLLPIDHADARELASVLSPLLSTRGTISAYSRTNTLIIKDKPSVVKMLVKAVKGKADLTQCDNWHPVPDKND